MIPRFLTVFLLTVVCASGSSGQKRNYAELVNTLIGTEPREVNLTLRRFESGFTYAGATYPFGMVQFTPAISFYDSSKALVINQLSGAGCRHMGNLPLLTLPGGISASPNDMKKLNSTSKTIKAVAGYYKVQMNGINTEVTVTPRTGMARFQFDKENKVNSVIIGTGINGSVIKEASVKIINDRTFEGFADGGYFCGPKTPVGYKIYFVAQFSAPADDLGVWEGEKLIRNGKSASGENSGVYFSFNNKQGVTYKVGVSYVSIENARQNLAKENSGFNFDQVRRKTTVEWNKYLSKIDVSGGSHDQTVQFYTHFYRALIHPNIFHDVNGEYMGADDKVHKTSHPYYTSFSNWDTYRTQIQLLSMLFPDKASDMIKSLILFAKQSGGGWPRWVLGNTETGIMIGDPTSIIVSNAYAFGARDFDHKKALQIMRKGAEDSAAKSQTVTVRPFFTQYLADGSGVPGSLFLEYTSADYAIAEFARQALNQNDIYKSYVDRSAKWRTLYNPAIKWLQGKNAAGGWEKLGIGWTEGTYKNYFWMVPYDINGLFEIIGGKDSAEARLDDFFTILNAGYTETYFAAGNEPDFQAPWMYNWTKASYKSQALVKRILKELYQNAANGLPGNDDLGTLGAWYIFASIGMYPMIPGVGGFTINGPAFPTIKMKLPAGNLNITGGDIDKPYISSVKINGKEHKNHWIDHDLIKKGGNIDYRLSDIR